MDEGVLDLRHVDRAHGAEVLGDDEVWADVGEGTHRVVEVLPPSHALPDEGFDGAGREAFGQRRGRDNAARASLWRVVALEGNAHDLIAAAEGEEDLGGLREQGHDPHGTEATEPPGRLRRRTDRAARSAKRQGARTRTHF